MCHLSVDVQYSEAILQNETEINSKQHYSKVKGLKYTEMKLKVREGKYNYTKYNLTLPFPNIMLITYHLNKLAATSDTCSIWDIIKSQNFWVMQEF